ncbi:hypothetical protein F5Y14DRAFT_192323 [Nemania sp. NC0429]|nr:hypothetical protein F5Y14DRAFT_192323 [Nemania sp. NC0429]
MIMTLSTEEGEAWVKVNRRKGRRRPGAAIGDVSAATPPPSTPTLSLEQVKQDHDRLAAHWRASPSYGRLQELLSTNATHTGNSIVVTKAICFGLGPFDPPADGSWERSRAAHIQLAAFLTIVEHLQSGASHQIRCVFQDPIFNSVDKAFIASLGHEVVESPIGFQLVDPESFAFGVHLYRDVYSQVIGTHFPAIFVGTSYELWEDLHGAENLDWARMKELDQLCVKAEFPKNQSDSTFFNTIIHWRRGDQR